ncbi:MAG: 50S ribosomal protein L30 [bacterium]|nr:50S ribosomal protein L30 [bacterium]
MAKTKESKIQIKLVRSLIGCSEAQCKVAQALGLRKKDQVVEHAKSATIMGMVNKISHLLEVCEA